MNQTPQSTAPMAGQLPHVLSADNVTKKFDTAEGPLVAVDNISFDVRPGEFLSVIGPSG